VLLFVPREVIATTDGEASAVAEAKVLVETADGTRVDRASA